MNHKGFTLLEVTLFMAISGSLALVAILGLAPRLRNVRFTQSVRSTEASLSRQLSVVDDGTNNQTSGLTCSSQGNSSFGVVVTDNAATKAGTSEECVLNGRLVVFGADSATYYTIASNRKLQVQTSNAKHCTDEIPVAAFERLFCYGPTVLSSSSKSEYSYTNGVKNTADYDAQPQAYGVIQDPATGKQYAFTYKANNNDLNGDAALNETLASDVNSGKTTACLTLGNRMAAIDLTVSSGATPQVSFEKVCS